MRFFAKIILALAAGLFPVADAFAKKAPKEAEPDSLTRMVAVFIAENTRKGIESMVANFEAYGEKINPEAVRTLVARNLGSGASDALAYTEASQWISRFMDEHSHILSERFLESAAAEPGAERLPSGLIIRTIEAGKGKNPDPGNVIAMRYTASLPDGTIFDTIGPEDSPMTAVVSNLAPGVAEGLCHMQAGGTYLLTIPGDLGYGAEGVPGVIPPNSALRFEVELVEIY